MRAHDFTATVSASPYDKDYEMAYVYCYDSSQRCCFSLSRFPDQQEIEVMVEDQSHHRRIDLCVHLKHRTLEVVLDAPSPSAFDRTPEYIIDLQLAEDQEPVLHAALRKIFDGKKGLRIDGTVA